MWYFIGCWCTWAFNRDHKLITHYILLSGARRFMHTNAHTSKKFYSFASSNPLWIYTSDMNSFRKRFSTLLCINNVRIAWTTYSHGNRTEQLNCFQNSLHWSYWDEIHPRSLCAGRTRHTSEMDSVVAMHSLKFACSVSIVRIFNQLADLKTFHFHSSECMYYEFVYIGEYLNMMLLWEFLAKFIAPT